MRRLPRLIAIVLGTFVVVLAVGNCGIAGRARGHTYDSVDAVPHHAWAIVPGALVRADGSPSVALVDRLDAARMLYKAGRVDRIFVSGDSRDHDEDGVMARWLIEQGVPADRIVRDGTGNRTRTTMEHARALGITEAVICTQQFHVARSVAWARHDGIEADGLEADLRWYDHQLTARLRETVARSVAQLEIWAD